MTVEQIIDTAELTKIKHLLETMLKGRYDKDDLRLVKKKNWIGTIANEIGHFSENKLQNLSKLILGEQKIYACSLEEKTPEPIIFFINPNIQNLKSLFFEISHMNFAVFPLSASWIMLHSVDNFSVIGGEQLFIESFLGRHIKEEVEDFTKNFIDDEYFMDSERNSWRKTKFALIEDYSQAKAGDEIIF